MRGGCDESPGRTGRPVLELRNAAFRLGPSLVFEDTNWALSRGAHWAVVGANGSGKTLFAEAIRGGLPLVRGEMVYGFSAGGGLAPEQAIGHLSFEQRRQALAGTVPASRWNSCEEELTGTVAEFLSYERVMEVNPCEVTSRRARARAAYRHRLVQATELLRLGSLLDRRLLALSNGEMQRVQLARALAQAVQLLILDEPFEGLDAASRQSFYRVLSHLAQKAVLPVLLLTARPQDLPRHVNRLLWLDRCRVAAAGPRPRILALPGFPQPSAPLHARARREPTAGPARPGLRRVPRRGPVLVALRNVTVRYGDQTVLREVNWEIRQGEGWGLVGPNGSGKTTLLSLMAGDHPQAYSNQVRVFGRLRGEGESIWELKRRIGWLSPDLQLHLNPDLSCLELVAAGFHDTLALYEPATGSQRARARQWLERLGLGKAAHQPVGALSPGQQRLVLLARALVKDPRLLLLDEPCQRLDAVHRQELLNTLESVIRKNRVTTVLVTHRSDELVPSIRHILHLIPGRAPVQTHR